MDDQGLMPLSGEECGADGAGGVGEEQREQVRWQRRGEALAMWREEEEDGRQRKTKK